MNGDLYYKIDSECYKIFTEKRITDWNYKKRWDIRIEIIESICKENNVNVIEFIKTKITTIENYNYGEGIGGGEPYAVLYLNLYLRKRKLKQLLNL